MSARTTPPSRYLSGLGVGGRATRTAPPGDPKPGGSVINFLPDPRIAQRDFQESADRTVAHSVDDIVSWLLRCAGARGERAARGGCRRTPRVQLDLKIDLEWKRTCFYSERLPAVPLITHKAVWSAYTLAMVPDMSMRLYVLHTGDGVLIIDIDEGPDNPVTRGSPANGYSDRRVVRFLVGDLRAPHVGRSCGRGVRTHYRASGRVQTSQSAIRRKPSPV